MKPGNFDYYSPSNLDDALLLLQDYQDDAKVLAGGQSLVPMMNMRLVYPKFIVDLNRVGGLDYIKGIDGSLAIGAMTRQRMLERSEEVRDLCPLLYEVIPNIAHFQIRNRGTIGGSLAHSDPAADIPAAIAAMGATMVLASAQGERTVTSEEFFLTYFTTCIEPTELLREIRIPSWPERRGWSYLKLSRRHGDFALVGIAAHLTLDRTGACSDAAIAMSGVAGTPVRMRQAEQELIGSNVGDETIEQASQLVVEHLEPESDVHASADYRRHVSGVLTRRALKIALDRANGGAQGG